LSQALTQSPLPSLVLNRHRHLKWPALDWLEQILMVLCGLLIFGFTASVFLDVATRTLGRPWLWLQLVTTGFFAWGIFIGMAVAVRRNDHLYLVEITKGMSGSKRTFMETFNRLAVFGVALAMIVFGWKNAVHDMGSLRMPSLLPMTVYTASVPVSGALIALFCIEQIVNGWKNGFEGPEDHEITGEATLVEHAEAAAGGMKAAAAAASSSVHASSGKPERAP
jgi:TRAP-type transport system small permease protein